MRLLSLSPIVIGAALAVSWARGAVQDRHVPSLGGSTASPSLVDSSSPPAASSVVELRWEVLQRYGAPEPLPGARLGGGALATIGGAYAFPDGRVAVLDPTYKKVVLYAKNGDFLRVIGRGYGHGPGELAQPIAFDVSDDRIAVFDYDGNRVTVFDTLGSVIWSRPTRRAKQIALRADTVYGTYMPGRTHLLWRQPSDDLASATNLIPVTERFLRDHNPRGAVAMLGRDFRGQLLVAHSRPGFWFEIGSAGVSQQMGEDLLKDAKFWMYQDIAVAPGNTVEIVALSDRYVGISYTAIVRGDDQRPRTGRQELAVFDRRTGSLVGAVNITGDDAPGGTHIGPGGRPLEVLAGRESPYPHVVRMVLRGLPD